MRTNFGKPVLMLTIAALVACGGDSLKLGLPQGAQVRYLERKPASGNISVSCDTVNASVYVSPEERNRMRLRCVVHLKDRQGQPIEQDASITIQAVVQEQGRAPDDGSEVHFKTSAGSFEPFSASTTEPVQDIDVETLGGIATATLYTFPGAAGVAEVTASYQTINENNVSDSTTVTVSEGLSVLLESPSCTVRRTWEENEPFVFLISPTCDPLDVEPISGEPSHMEDNVIHNPRDGLFAMVFYVDGEESYDDKNQNGKYDPGEVTFGSDLAEPFVDGDDSGSYNNNEPFKDVDGDNEWSDANGRWDGETLVWTTAYVMFTGPPHESANTTHFEPSGINIEAGGVQQIYLYLMDINHNPVAANGSSDSLSFSVDGGATLTQDEIILQNHMGVKFSNGHILPASFNENRSYEIKLQDENPDAAESVTLHTTVTWTPAPDNDYYSAQTQEMALEDITGTAN